MKSLYTLKHTIVAMVVVAFSACAEVPFDTTHSTAVADEVENPDYEIIKSLGLQTEGIVDDGDNYIVEGDILLRKVHIDSLRQFPKTRQALRSFITRDRVNGIRVKITSNNLPDPAWRQAVREAVEIWNNVENCAVYFYKIEKEILPHNVRVFESDFPEVADAGYPNLGTPGDQIRINPNNTWTHEQKVNILVHEFGHILGLAHTDLIKASNYATYHIKGTPDWSAGQRDVNSVMRHDTAGEERGNVSSWSGFTAGDLAAIQAMYGYPIWSQEIIGPTQSLPVNTSTYTLKLGTNLTGFNVSWYVNNSLKQNSTSLSFTPTSLPPGQVTLKAVVNYDGVNYEANKVITVFDLSISGSGDPQINRDATYYVPTTLPAGVAFNGWTVSPSSGYVLTGGTTGRYLTIKFTSYGTYTISANYTLPNGVSYAATKQIAVTSPTPPQTPIINVGAQKLGDYYWVRPGGQVTVYIGNYDSAATYEWYTQGLTMSLHLGSTDVWDINIPNVYSGYSTRQIGCIAYKNGKYSECNYTWLYISSSPPGSRLYMLNDVDDDEATEDTVLESEDSGEIDG